MEKWERLRTPTQQESWLVRSGLFVFVFKGCPTIPWKTSVDLWELALENGVNLSLFFPVLERQWGYLRPSHQASFRDSVWVPLSVGHRLNFVLLHLGWKRKFEALSLSHIHQGFLSCTAFAPPPPPSISLYFNVHLWLSNFSSSGGLWEDWRYRVLP